jgi:hypothetical protein
LSEGGGGAKSSLGRAPVTVIGAMVAVGAVLGSAGLVAFGGSVGGGLAEGWDGVVCWAIATGAPTNRPTMAVLTGTRRDTVSLNDLAND